MNTKSEPITFSSGGWPFRKGGCQGKFSEEDAFFSPHSAESCECSYKYTTGLHVIVTSIIGKSSSQGWLGFSEAAPWGEVVVLFCSLLMSHRPSYYGFSTSGAKSQGQQWFQTMFSGALRGSFRRERGKVQLGPFWIFINLRSEVLTTVTTCNWKPPWLPKMGKKWPLKDPALPQVCKMLWSTMSARPCFCCIERADRGREV